MPNTVLVIQHLVPANEKVWDIAKAGKGVILTPRKTTSAATKIVVE